MPNATPTHELDLLGEAISYEVRHSEDATQSRIDVDIHGVRVILPPDSEEDPESLLRENAVWVVEKKQKYDAYREQIPDRSFEEGAVFPYFDEPHLVVVEQRPASDVLDGEIKLAEYHVEQTSIRRALERLYQRQARTHFEGRAEHYANEMNVEYAEIEIRNQRTKWGSCSTNGTLGLNWRLMMAPHRVIDYVVIHELAHLQEPNHTSAFWDFVAEHDPDYRDHAEWIERNSTSLIFTEEDI
jgi:predicted metal-dependent hydrolase